MKKAATFAVLAVFLVSSGYAIDEITAIETGCEDAPNGGVICPQQIFIQGIPVKFTGQITCFSDNTSASCTTDCLKISDLVCFSWVETQQDVSYRECKTKINETGIEASAICLNRTLQAELYSVAISPKILDFSSCGKTTTNDTYQISCQPPAGEKIMDALLTPDGLILFKMHGAASFAGFAQFVEYAIYGVLAAAVVCFGYLMLKPKKGQRK